MNEQPTGQVVSKSPQVYPPVSHKPALDPIVSPSTPKKGILIFVVALVLILVSAGALLVKNYLERPSVSDSADQPINLDPESTAMNVVRDDSGDPELPESVVSQFASCDSFDCMIASVDACEPVEFYYDSTSVVGDLPVRMNQVYRIELNQIGDGCVLSNQVVSNQLLVPDVVDSELAESSQEMAKSVEGKSVSCEISRERIIALFSDFKDGNIYLPVRRSQDGIMVNDWYNEPGCSGSLIDDLI